MFELWVINGFSASFWKVKIDVNGVGKYPARAVSRLQSSTTRCRAR